MAELHRPHLIALANRAVVETEEVDEMIQELTDTDSRDFHGTTKSLRENTHTHKKHTWLKSNAKKQTNCRLSCSLWRALTQKKSSFMRMANLQWRSLRMRTAEEDSSETQRPTPASWPHSRSCLSIGVWDDKKPLERDVIFFNHSVCASLESLKMHLKWRP